MSVALMRVALMRVALKSENICLPWLEFSVTRHCGIGWRGLKIFLF
jgi:hypothetical protein